MEPGKQSLSSLKKKKKRPCALFYPHGPSPHFPLLSSTSSHLKVPTHLKCILQCEVSTIHTSIYFHTEEGGKGLDPEI